MTHVQKRTIILLRIDASELLRFLLAVALLVLEPVLQNALDDGGGGQR